MFIGEYRFGIDRVGSPSVCKNVSEEMKLVVQVREEKSLLINLQ
jgi:hypothetical protein